LTDDGYNAGRGQPKPENRNSKIEIRKSDFGEREEALRVSSFESSMNPRTTPEALLASAAEGDRRALGELYDQLAPQLFGLIRSILSDRRESERLLEEIFLKLWKEARLIVRAQVSVAAWLALRARAQAVERVRTTRGAAPGGRRAADPFPEMLRWLPDSEAIGVLEERRALLKKVLSQLPQHQLQAVELITFQGRTETELEGDLGEPLARVKSELRAAMGFLRHRRRAVVGSWAVIL
jgi:RNA polymerase sigma-70 factor, ECF subfamily